MSEKLEADPAQVYSSTGRIYGQRHEVTKMVIVADGVQ